MKLEFDIIKTFDDGVDMNFAHIPDSTFVKYFKDGKHVVNQAFTDSYTDVYGRPVYVTPDFNNPNFKNEPNRLTAQAVSKYGVRNFPQYGSYGWYTTLYSDLTRVVIPIERGRSDYAHPALSVTTTPSEITVDITDPESIKYDCYRVIFRLGYFTHEYITYEKQLIIPQLPGGEYEVSAIGHRDDGIVSVETDMQLVTATGPEAPSLYGGGSSPDGITLVVTPQNRLAISQTVMDTINDKFDEAVQDGNVVTFKANNIDKDIINVGIADNGGD